jgi:hypothetical protein
MSCCELFYYLASCYDYGPLRLAVCWGTPRTICLLQGVVLDASDRRTWKGMPKGRNTNELRGRVAWHHANRLFLLQHFLSSNNDKTTSYLFVYTESLKCILVKLKFVYPRAILAYAVWILGLNAWFHGCVPYVRNTAMVRVLDIEWPYWYLISTIIFVVFIFIFVFKFFRVKGSAVTMRSGYMNRSQRRWSLG